MFDKGTLKKFIEDANKNALEELYDLHRREGTTEWGVEDEEKRIKYETIYELTSQIICICEHRGRF